MFEENNNLSALATELKQLQQDLNIELSTHRKNYLTAEEEKKTSLEHISSLQSSSWLRVSHIAGHVQKLMVEIDETARINQALLHKNKLLQETTASASASS